MREARWESSHPRPWTCQSLLTHAHRGLDPSWPSSVAENLQTLGCVEAAGTAAGRLSAVQGLWGPCSLPVGAGSEAASEQLLTALLGGREGPGRPLGCMGPQSGCQTPTSAGQGRGPW